MIRVQPSGETWSITPLLGPSFRFERGALAEGEIIRVPEKRRAALFDGCVSSSANNQVMDVARNLWTHAFRDRRHLSTSSRPMLALRIATAANIWPVGTTFTSKGTPFTPDDGSRAHHRDLVVSSAATLGSMPSNQSVDVADVRRARRVDQALQAAHDPAILLATEQLLRGDSVRVSDQSRALFEYVVGIEALVLESRAEQRFRFSVIVAELLSPHGGKERADWFNEARSLYDLRSHYAHGATSDPARSEVTSARYLLRVVTLAAALLHPGGEWSKKRRPHLFQELASLSGGYRQAVETAVRIVEAEL